MTAIELIQILDNNNTVLGKKQAAAGNAKNNDNFKGDEDGKGNFTRRAIWQRSISQWKVIYRAHPIRVSLASSNRISTLGPEG